MNFESVNFCPACKCNKLEKFFKLKKNGTRNKTCIVCNNRYSKNKIIVTSSFVPIQGTCHKCVKCKKILDVSNFKTKKYINDINKTCNNCLLKY